MSLIELVTTILRRVKFRARTRALSRGILIETANYWSETYFFEQLQFPPVYTKIPNRNLDISKTTHLRIFLEMLIPIQLKSRRSSP